jgi:LPXTG-motif cell wall-anchored protein
VLSAGDPAEAVAGQQVLAATGSDGTALALGGIALVGVGSLVVGLARRRRQA